MNPPKSREEELFFTALALPTAGRSSYLASACGEDDTLRGRVELLLRAHEEARSFMETSPAAAVAETPTRHTLQPEEKPGETIGRYKLLQKIGEGGCGVVYMAEQQQPVVRRVALKVIKLGMDTKEVIARFEAERQALALMNHPNIASVLDGGATEAGRPFFVMELVRGVPITKFCDEQNLTTAARLELFTAVCHAVQHAHQKGIIHRDLKPSNILVTLHDGKPVPKVIDFGIAKATQGKLTDSTVFTAFEQFIGTPAYMSPEQAEMSGLDIDTRSDIYSLGVLLYELLTGRPPFDPKTLVSAGLDEIRRIIREVEPPRPSTQLSTLAAADRTTIARLRGVDPAKHRVQLSGDLDWIVMKALEKNRARRYETPSEFAADIARHLGNEPVLACPPSTVYRLSKLIGRYKLAFTAAAMIAVAVAAGAIVSTWQAIRATRAEHVAVAERTRAENARTEAEAARRREAALRIEAEKNQTRAETEATRSSQVAAFMKAMLTGIGPRVALGRDTQLLREIVQQTEARLQAELTQQPAVLAELRDTLGLVYYDLGDYPRAIELFRSALADRRRLWGNENVAVASSLDHLGLALHWDSEIIEADSVLREAVAIRRKLLGNEHPDTATALAHLGEVLWRQRRFNESLNVRREVLAVRRKIYGPEHADVAEILVEIATTLGSSTADGIRDIRGAEAHYREGLALQRKLFGAEHPVVAATLHHMSLALNNAGKRGEAIQAISEALELRRKLLSPDHYLIGLSMVRLGWFLGLVGRIEEAKKYLHEGVDRLRKSRGTQFDTQNALFRLGELLAYRMKGREAEAETVAREALAMEVELLGKGVPTANSSIRLLRDVLRAQGKNADTTKIEADLIAQMKATFGPDHVTTLRAVLCCSARQLESGQLIAGTVMAEEAFAGFQRTVGLNHRETVTAMDLLGAFYWAQRRKPEYAALIQQAHAASRAILPPESSQLAVRLRSDATRFYNSGDTATGRKLIEEALQLRKTKLPPDPGSTAELLSDLALADLRENDPGAAEKHIREALTLVGESLPETDRRRFGATLGEALAAQKKFAEAEPLLREGYDDFKRRGANWSSARRATALRLVSVYSGLGKPDEAAKWQRIVDDLNRAEAAKTAAVSAESLESQKRTLGAEHRDTLLSMSNLAGAYLKQGKHADAATLSAEAWAGQKRVLGPDHPQTLASMDHLAGAYHGQGKYADAAALFSQLWEIQKRTLGPENPDTLTTMMNLTNTYSLLGRSAESRPLRDQLLEKQRRVLGPEHPHTLQTMSVLAQSYLNQGRFAEAAATSAETLERQQRVFGPEHANSLATMGTLAAANERIGAFAEAEATLCRLIAGLEKTGTDALVLATHRTRLGRVMLKQKKFAEAEPILREASNVRDKKEPDLWTTFVTRSVLGGVLAGQGRHAEAEPLLVSGYERLLHYSATIPSVDMNEAFEGLHQFYVTTSQPGKAAALRQDREARRHTEAGRAFERNGDFASAINEYDAATRLLPGFSTAWNGLAWLRATAPLAAVRDGAAAVIAARKACELTGWKNVGHIDTLAAAHAEAGEFDSAVEFQRKSLDLSAADHPQRKEWQDRLALYRDRKPYHQPERMTPSTAK